MELERIERREKLKDSRLRLRNFQKQITKTFDNRVDEYYLDFINQNNLKETDKKIIKQFCNYIKQNK